MAHDIKFLDLYMRQSEFMWRFQQTVAMVEIGVFSGWYVLYKNNNFMLAIALLVVGTIILGILALIIHRTSQYLNSLREPAMKEIPSLLPRPFLGIKSYQIAIAIPILLMSFNVLLAIWQIKGIP
jgi:hypothetical protein